MVKLNGTLFLVIGYIIERDGNFPLIISDADGVHWIIDYPLANCELVCPD